MAVVKTCTETDTGEISLLNISARMISNVHDNLLKLVTVRELVFVILEKGQKTEMRFRTWVKGDKVIKTKQPKTIANS